MLLLARLKLLQHGKNESIVVGKTAQSKKVVIMFTFKQGCSFLTFYSHKTTSKTFVLSKAAKFLIANLT